MYMYIHVQAYSAFTGSYSMDNVVKCFMGPFLWIQFALLKTNMSSANAKSELGSLPCIREVAGSLSVDMQSGVLSVPFHVRV